MSETENSTAVQVLRLEMQMENQKIRHDAEIRELKMNQNFELKNLRDKIQNLEQQVAIYEEEENESLSGVGKEDKYELIKQIGGGILSNAGEIFFKNNPALLKGIGLSGDANNKDATDTKQINASSEKAEASFSEAPVSEFDFSGLDKEHEEGLRNLIEVFSGLSKEDFKKLFDLICGLYDNESGELRHELLNFALEFMVEENEKREKKTETKN